MTRLVLKFGGTSMAGIDRIRRVAGIVKREHEAGHQVAVLVSAMAGETDRLVSLCQEADPLFDPREYDVVVSSGEQVTAGLLALTLQSLGNAARSWLGWQVPVTTDGAHSKARIQSIDGTSLLDSLAQGEIAVIAGFQGRTAQSRISTLGRGGTDTSAVALAAAIGAERCDIYTDVDGIYTTDPRIVTNARKLKAVTYEEMLELASVGSKVLQTRSVNLAMQKGVRVQVLSSFVADDAPSADTIPGTLVVSDQEVQLLGVDRHLITGIAADRGEAKITLTCVPDQPGTVATIFGVLADENITVDMIIQNVAKEEGQTDVTFTVTQTDLLRTQTVLEKHRHEIRFAQINSDPQVAKVSIVGAGMRNRPGVAATMFHALAERSINILAISTSEIKTSVLIDSDETELAVRVLHSAFELDGD